MSSASWHPLARQELFDSIGFYEEAEPGLGDAFLTQVEKVVDQICLYPHTGRRTLGEIRQVPLWRFPYDVVYRIDEEGIFLLALAHQRRRPRYWAGRTQR